MDASLRLANDVSVIGSASDFTYKWGLNLGLGEDRAARLSLAVDEILSNVVLFALKDEPETYEVEFVHDELSAEVIVREYGEPFDPDRHRYEVDAALERGRFEGAGLFLVERLVDDFVFINRGRSGKEFRVSQRIEPPAAAEMWMRFEHPDRSGSSTIVGRPAPADVTYRYTKATPADAEDIAKLIFRTYRYDYTKEDVYFPKQIAESLENEQRFGVMARTSSGEPVGYFAVSRLPGTNIGEVGEAVVSPPHRRRGIMTQMLNQLIERANAAGLRGLFGEAVTVHDFSQRVNEKLGFRTTALVLADIPIMSYRTLIADYPQKVSVVVDFLPLDMPESREVHVPRKYRSILLGIYRDLRVNIIDVASRPIPGGLQTDVDTRINYAHRSALLVVREIGRDVGTVVDGIRRELHQSDINAIFVDLPIANRSVDEAVRQLENLCFTFSGLMPLIHKDQDYLRMQCIAVEIDLDLVATHTKTAQAIKERIRAELKWNMNGKTAG